MATIKIYIRPGSKREQIFENLRKYKERRLAEMQQDFEKSLKEKK